MRPVDGRAIDNLDKIGDLRSKIIRLIIKPNRFSFVFFFILCYYFLISQRNKRKVDYLPPMPIAPPGFILISLSLCDKRTKTRKYTLNLGIPMKYLISLHIYILYTTFKVHSHQWSCPSCSSPHADGASVLPSLSYEASPPPADVVPPLVCLKFKTIVWLRLSISNSRSVYERMSGQSKIFVNQQQNSN